MEILILDFLLRGLHEKFRVFYSIFEILRFFIHTTTFEILNVTLSAAFKFFELIVYLAFGYINWGILSGGIGFAFC